MVQCPNPTVSDWDRWSLACFGLAVEWDVQWDELRRVSFSPVPIRVPNASWLEYWKWELLRREDVQMLSGASVRWLMGRNLIVVGPHMCVSHL